MSVALTPRATTFSSGAPPSAAALIKAVDQVPETRGFGIVLIANGITRTIRTGRSGDETIVFEYRQSPIGNRPAPVPHIRTSSTSPATEWLSLGFNCGGAVLSWIGVVGTAAAAPVTGGQSLWGTAALWGGALATTATCSVSVFRVGAMASGYSSVDAAMDNSAGFVWTMRGLDVVGLLGVGGAIKDVMETRDALDTAGMDWRRAAAGQISRQQRKLITSQLGLVGGKRVAATLISQVVKQRLLAALAAAAAITGSISTGSTHDLIVWLVSTPHKG